MSTMTANSATNELQNHQREFIEGALATGALKFGSFVLKSGRTSPYFFNAGLLSTGPLISAVATSYATLISQLSSSQTSPLQFDVLFGPAYKGIPFVAVTALELYKSHGISVGYAFDRKEAKAHGEGGMMVGSSVQGKRVVILDDVMTAGTAIRQSITLVQAQGGKVVGIVLLLDREEVAGGIDPSSDERSTVDDVEKLLGGETKVLSTLRMRELMSWLEEKGQHQDLASMKAYRARYGVDRNTNSA